MEWLLPRHSLFFFVYQVLFAQIFSIWVKSLKHLLETEVSLFGWLYFWDFFFVFLSGTIVPPNWGAVFDLENSSWLHLVGKLYVILFIVGDSVCLSLRSKTEAGFLVIVLVGKPLKAKGSGHVISFELKLIFCSCSVVSVFF